MSLDSLITKDICHGVLPAGKKIKIDYLCARYQTTLSPVREALFRLAMIGMLDYKKNFGFSVNEITKHEFMDIYKARKLLIPLHLSKAMSNKNLDWYKDISSKVFAINHFNRPQKDYSMEEFSSFEFMNVQLYSTILDNANSYTMMKLHHMLDTLSKPYRFALFSSLPDEALATFYRDSYVMVEKLCNAIYDDKLDQATCIIDGILNQTMLLSEGVIF